jgi:hypothetical protein
VVLLELLLSSITVHLGSHLDHSTWLHYTPPNVAAADIAYVLVIASERTATVSWDSTTFMT